MDIKRISAIILSFFYVGLACSQPAVVKMFRDNPAHLAKASSGNQQVFDTRSWKFEAGSPVRSTPLVVSSLVYFGTTGGEFFALNKKTGAVKWNYQCGSPINSSAAYADGKIFFSDNQQKIYAVNESNGNLVWSVKLGPKLEYPWRFDYYYSSPILYKNKLIIGGDDGNLYVLEQSNGKLLWKFNVNAVVRATPAVYNDQILFGDVNGKFHSVDFKTGKELWSFKAVGDSLNNEQWGFDRRAILSSAVVAEDKIFFGCRAGFLYCLDARNGTLIWKMDHKISWVISTPAVKDSIVITGTSDARFVQAINIKTGQEIWKFRTPLVVWSSPLIVDQTVYAADFDGQLFCLDLKSGRRISQICLGDKIMSSPVYDDQLLYVGSDDGNFYAFKGRSVNTISNKELKRFVFYDPVAKNYFQGGSDIRIRDYLAGNGFKVVGPDTIGSILSNNSTNSVLVFASNYFPSSVTHPADHSLIRKFLDDGGRILILGANSLAYKLEEETHQPIGFNVPFADSVLGINYGPNDTRAFAGQFACFATEAGKEFGLQEFWTSVLFLRPNQVDVVLGKNENGLVSSYVKKYKNGGAFIQLIMHPKMPQNLDAIIKVAEAKF